MNYRFMTRRDALSLLSSACGTGDMIQLKSYLEDVRQLIYSLYGDSDYIPQIVRCFPIQCFCETDCGRCTTKYKGITLCHDMSAIEAMWWQDPSNQVTLQDDWRNWSPQICDYRDCRIRSVDQAGYFPLEYSISPCGCAVQLIFIIHERADDGKIIRVKYIDQAGHKQEEKLQANFVNPVSTEGYVFDFQEGGMLLEDDFCGVVTVQQGVRDNPTSGYPSPYDGRTLSMYEPHTRFPAFRRIRLENVPDSICQVNIRASRKFCSLTNDWDVVETDNRLVIQWLGKAVRIYKKDNISPQDKAVAQGLINDARSLLMGDKIRDRGKFKRTTIHQGRSAMMPRTTLNRFRS